MVAWSTNSSPPKTAISGPTHINKRSFIVVAYGNILFVPFVIWNDYSGYG
jgi:hypothetical protein